MAKGDQEHNLYHGIYRGICQNSSDPLGLGRITLLIPSLFGQSVTDWSYSAGVGTLPSPGDGVWVMFEAGDPSFPVWLGTFDGTDIPTVWMSIPLASGMTTLSGSLYTPASRIVGGMVSLCGAVGGAIGTTGVLLGTLSTPYRPAKGVEMTGSVETSGGAYLAASIQVGTNGNLIVFTGTAATSVMLDGLNYRLV